jgi:hypothetical protein
MEVHKPKLVHDWRELLTEIGVIVIGVLVALSAEQVAEEIHWQHRVHGAIEAMRAELRQNDRDAYYILAIQPCSKAKLDEIETALRASRDHDAPVPQLAPYSRPARPWSTDAWESARALQITSHISTEDLRRYSFAYVFPASMRRLFDPEREDIYALNTLEINNGRLQPAERDRLFEALVRSRGTAHSMDTAAMFLLSASKQLNLQLTDNERELELARAREDYGTCANAPKLKDVTAEFFGFTAKSPIH